MAAKPTLWQVKRELKALWKLCMAGNITYSQYCRRSEPLKKERKLLLMREESGWG